MKLGDTFLWSPNNGTPHLYIVLCEPSKFAGKCVIANLTSFKSTQQSFLIRMGCHAFVTKDSEVNFGDSMIVEALRIERFARMGQAFIKDPLDLAIIKNIAIRAISHPAVAGEVQEMLVSEWS